MRVMLVLFAAGLLGLSAFAAWLFFGGPEDDPTRVRLENHLARIEAARPAAEAGDPHAQYALGRLYHEDVSGHRDPAAAFEWYSKAARQRHPAAQVALGGLYANGDGVRQDYYRAAEWYRLAANLGRNADAKLALAELHFHGQGVPHDVAEARRWYREAADQGHPVAQHRLGAMIRDGWAGRPDPVQAYKWFTLAMRGHARVTAFDPALDPAAARARMAQDMTEDQIARAEAEARDWRPRH